MDNTTHQYFIRYYAITGLLSATWQQRFPNIGHYMLMYFQKYYGIEFGYEILSVAWLPFLLSNCVALPTLKRQWYKPHNCVLNIMFWFSVLLRSILI